MPADPMEVGNQVEVDNIGIVTVQDGPSLLPGELIAPGRLHRMLMTPHYPQQLPGMPKRFWPLAAGAAGSMCRLRTARTSSIAGSRRFELIPKTVVPIGFVGCRRELLWPAGFWTSTGTGFPPRRTKSEMMNAVVRQRPPRAG